MCSSKSAATYQNYNNLAANLRLLMKKRNVSESDIAKTINLPALTIRRLVSEETTDPRLSTIRLIADYFDVSLDFLSENTDESCAIFIKRNRPTFVPILDWETAAKIKSLKEIDLTIWKDWQAITLKTQHFISEKAFALTNRPSMETSFPRGTIFVIEPNSKPEDGDMVLVKIKKNNELSLRKIIMDPPEWMLESIAIGSKSILHSEDEHKIVGVVELTILERNRQSQ
jgi:transcriptional regulator with XRE-family HTH domain